jgi:hypothetical protein
MTADERAIKDLMESGSTNEEGLLERVYHRERTRDPRKNKEDSPLCFLSHTIHTLWFAFEFAARYADRVQQGPATR